MKYMCKSCKKKCDDITKHLMTVHKFSKAIIESQLKSNPNSYKSAFEKLEKWQHQESDSNMFASFNALYRFLMVTSVTPAASARVCWVIDTPFMTHE